MAWKSHTAAKPQPAAARREARWIGTDAGEPWPLPLFHLEFGVERKVIQATLRISGLGQCEAYINGRNVTESLLTPGWTNYRKRAFYNSYNVTALLKNGPNALGVMIGIVG